jgi:hypothetical protein
MREGEQGLLFLKKKKQKNFWSLGAVARFCKRPQEQKFFASFFQKRSACFLGFARKSWMPAFAGMTGIKEAVVL